MVFTFEQGNKDGNGVLPISELENGILLLILGIRKKKKIIQKSDLHLNKTEEMAVGFSRQNADW